MNILACWTQLAEAVLQFGQPKQPVLPDTLGLSETRRSPPMPSDGLPRVRTLVEGGDKVEGVVVKTFGHRQCIWLVVYVEPETYLVRDCRAVEMLT